MKNIILNILVIERNHADIEQTEELLFDARNFTFITFKAKSIQEAIEIINSEDIQVVLLGSEFLNGHELDNLKKSCPQVNNLPVISLSSISEESDSKQQLDKGIDDYYLKGSSNPALLVHVILTAIEHKKNQLTIKTYQKIVANSGEGIISGDINGTIQTWNKGAELIFGYTANEVIGRSADILYPDDSKEQIQNVIQIIKSQGSIMGLEVKRKRKDGKIIDVSVSISPVKNDANVTTGAFIVVRDISRRKMIERQLRMQLKVTGAFVESPNINIAGQKILALVCQELDWQGSDIWIVDKDQDVLRHIYHWGAGDEEAKPIDEKTTLNKGESIAGEIWLKKKVLFDAVTNKEISEERKRLLNNANLKNFYGIPIAYQSVIMGVILFFSNSKDEIDEDNRAMLEIIANQFAVFIARKRAERDLIYLSQHDGLTGLANRVMLEEAVQRAILSAKRHHRLAGLMYIDLDFFKNINDTLGHAVGDLLLKEVAARLRNVVRETDMVARFGGDEFAIALPDVASKSDVEFIAKKIVRTLSQPFVLLGKKYNITASVGISIYPDNGDTYERLLKNADIALYQVKMAGKNDYLFCSQDVEKMMMKKIQLENELHAAVNKKQFILHYQPIVDIRTNKINSIEALLRWKKDNEEIVFPSEFIQVLEQSNLINRVGEWVLKEACRQIKLWENSGLKNISVNVSVHQFDMNFATLVEKIIKEANIEPSALILEVTETLLMHETERNTYVLNALKKLGIKISIDDFGKGYSSFSYLLHINFSSIKIDKSFVEGLPNDETSIAIVTAIIAMAHSLNIKVIAEGVERKEQLEYLKGKKCDFYQGFYYSTPLPAEELLALMQNEKNELSPQNATIPDNKDPFQGFASCPDTQRAYLAQSNKNQAEWRQDSENIIDEFIASIGKFKNFQEAYAYLADKRHRIAVNLKQRNEEGRTDYYGAFRNVGDHFRKIIHYGDGEQFWKWQKSKIFELVYKLIDPARHLKIDNRANGYIYENEHMGLTRENVSISNRPAVYYSVLIKSPYPDQIDKTLSIVELFEYEDERFNTIRIEYTPIEQEQLAKYYQIADGYYQSLLNWQQDDGVDAFFATAARLAYLLAHLLLVKHGNVGITEWMLRAIAFKNGLYLGQFNYAEKISWDFKAVLTPDPEEYVAWFKQNLFQDYMLVNPSILPRKFTFTRDQLQN